MAIQRLAAEHHAEDPFIEVTEIQGDILIGLQKKAEAFVAFSIADPARLKQVVADLASHGEITSLDEVRRRENQLQALKQRGDETLIPMPGMNIGFTHRGLGRLLGDPDYGDAANGLDAAFQAGAQRSAASLGDDPTTWPEPFRDGGVDGMLLVTGEDAAAVQRQVNGLLTRLAGGIGADPYIEIGRVRKEQPGHEHFGFADGISQPGIRGLSERRSPHDPEQGLPGQDLLWPGAFVYGYPGQVAPQPPNGPAAKETQGPITEPPLPWMRNGSYMVWRRLEQKVLQFRATRDEEASRLGIDPALLEARMVGRWPSGAPLVLSPLHDDRAKGAEYPRANNDFEYQALDPDQRRCPYAAHVRKMYPRDDLNDTGPAFLAGESGEAFVQAHRIMRAGIPFGDKIEPGETLGHERSRGLMFVCYQTSIGEQFEFIQKQWANDPEFVFGKRRPGTGEAVTPGRDPIIGQGHPRVMDEPVPNEPAGDRRSKTGDLPDFVSATAAAYLFMPSLTALRTGFEAAARR